MIDVQINDAEVEAHFAELNRRLTDMSRPMQDIALGLRDTTEDRFFQGVSPEGFAWAANTEATLARKSDIRPLFGGSGAGLALHSSIFANSGPDYAEVGTNKEQGAVMHYGAKKGAFGQTTDQVPIPFGDIPARPFLGLSEIDRTNIAETVREWLEDVEGS